MKLIRCCWVAAWLAVPSLLPAQVRSTLAPSVLDLTNSVALPGAIRVPITLLSANLEVADWTAAPAPSNHVGQFVFRFQQPETVGIVVTYGPAEVSYFDGANWQQVVPPSPPGRLLRHLPLPRGIRTSQVKIKVPAQPIGTNGKAWQATLAYAGLVPARLENIAATARTTASGGRDARVVVDGIVLPGSNFSAPPAGPGLPAFIQLQWPQPVVFRGCAYYRGTNDLWSRMPNVAIYLADDEPTASGGVMLWHELNGAKTLGGVFRTNQVFITRESRPTRAVRFYSTDSEEPLGIGEIAILKNLDEPAVTTRSEKPFDRVEP